MVAKKILCTDEEFKEIFSKNRLANVAAHFNVSRRTILDRRKDVEGRLGERIRGPLEERGSYANNTEQYPDHIDVDVFNGHVFVGSDLHIWPGPVSPAIRAFIKLLKELNPKAVYLNGDVIDFPRISRHAPIGWETNPLPSAEIEAAQDILHEIEMACGRGVRKIWPLGNHDARFESKLALHNPEYAHIKGLHLSDHFPNWERCWLSIVNQEVAIKHRYKSGIHAPHNNALWSGMTMITGHLHSQRIYPLTDYNGTRWGVDTGTMANIYGRQFRNYTEENPRNWRSGFCILTFKNGMLLPPELVTVIDEKHVAFRGELIKV